MWDVGNSLAEKREETGKAMVMGEGNFTKGKMD